MLMYCGHTPAEIDAMPVSDLEQFVEALPLLIANTNGLEVP